MKVDQAAPNFLIGGAPKGGTTALANYLRDHPNIFFSQLKEPFFFATDLPSMRKDAGVESDAEYQKLFESATDEHLAIGEGSTLYLYSDCAIKNALQWNARMKFIFMIRRPSEIAHAYHMQMRFHEMDDLESFSDAWDAQEFRCDDSTLIPKRCHEPRLLEYAKVAAVGIQIQRAKKLIPEDQLHIILFDDFVKNTRQSYVDALEFLGVPDDGREEFLRENAAMKARFPILTRIMRSSTVRRITAFAKRYFSGRLFEIAKSAKHSVMLRRAPRKALDPEFDLRLHQSFLPEVELLERLLDRDLTAWKTPKAKTPEVSSRKR